MIKNSIICDICECWELPTKIILLDHEIKNVTLNSK